MASCRPGDIIEIEISGVGAQAEGVGRWQGMAVFVPGALPGERVTARVTQAKKSFARAALLDVRVAHAQRLRPACPLSSSCGGCDLQHAAYPLQLALKRQIVAQALARIGHISCPVSPVLPAARQTHYRSRVVLHCARAGSGLTAGFFQAGSHQVQPLAGDCLLMRPALRELLQALLPRLNAAAAALTGLRALALRCNSSEDALLLTLITDAPLALPDSLICGMLAAQPRLCGIWQCSGTPVYGAYGGDWRLLAGTGRLPEQLGAIRLMLSPASFTQVHAEQTLTMYDTIRRFAALSGKETLFDLYSGVGGVALTLAAGAARVVGVESYAPAAADAAANAARNQITNCSFRAQTAEAALPALAAQGIRPDVVVLDPPRAGCAPPVLAAVLAAAPQRIVYASCDPATLARDLKTLTAANYTPTHIQPIDMFPQTQHVEVCVKLEKSVEMAADNR